MNGSDKLIDAAELADLLGVPIGWVRSHTRSKAIPHVRLGRYVRYDKGRVVDWLRELEQGGGPRFRKHQPGRVE